MENYDYIERFKRLGFGMFVHFGLYSILGEGEWYLSANRSPNKRLYEKLPMRFDPVKNWAKELVKIAKSAGCRYINITARHHDGFSLYDTCGLSDYDAPHAKCGKDLIAEFTQACRSEGIVPFFYHTLLDWHDPRYKDDFSAYIDYLVESVALLCRNYGQIGGIWFDGMWDKPNADWQEDRLYGTIKKLQPEAMIINNTGLDALGKVGHSMLDSVTFERGHPAYVDNSDRPRAGEMCQILNDHWGYAKADCNYKAVGEIIENLVDCRRHNCNFLLNAGLTGNGKMQQIDKCIFEKVGEWIRANRSFVYDVRKADTTAENADILTDGKYYYAVIKNVIMTADPNVAQTGIVKKITVQTEKKLRGAVWLDSGASVQTDGNVFYGEPFSYGTSRSVRVARFELKE